MKISTSPAFFSRHLSALLLALFSTLSFGAAIDVAGRQVVVTQPKGYCWLDMNGSENLMAEQAALLAERTGQELLLLFARCEELKQLRAGKKTYLATLGQITALKSKAGGVRATHLARKEVIQRAQTSFAQSTTPISGVRNAANRIVPGTLLEIGQPRMLDLNADAFYVGALTRGRTFAGLERLMAAVVAHSVLNGIEVVVRVGEDASREPYDFKQLLVQSKNLMRELVSLND